MRNNNQLIIGQTHTLKYTKNESKTHPYIAVIRDKQGDTVKKIGLTEKTSTQYLRELLKEYERTKIWNTLEQKEQSALDIIMIDI